MLRLLVLKKSFDLPTMLFSFVVLRDESAASLVGNMGAAAARRSPRRRKMSEDLESTPSPHKAGVQRNISMPKPMKL